MKDLPHHIKKLNRQVVRSALREENQGFSEEEAISQFKKSKEEERKIEKRTLKAQEESRTQHHDSPEDRNWKMKHRVPIFDRNNAKPKTTKPTAKKTPRI